MKELKIAGALPIEQFYARLTPRSLELVKKGDDELINNVAAKMLTITLKNIIKALEIPNLTFNVKTEYINPLVLEERKAKEAELQRAQFMERQEKLIEVMSKAIDIANDKSPDKKVDPAMIDKHKEVLAKLRTKNISPVINNDAINALEKCVNKIKCDVVVVVDNAQFENAGAYNQISSIFNEATNRFLNDVKIERKEKVQETDPLEESAQDPF